MTKGQRQGRSLRNKLRTTGRLDAEGAANMVGLDVFDVPFHALQELKVDDGVAVAARLSPEWRRWVIGHAMGHHAMHPGNHRWLRIHTQLALKHEREAESFAYGLLVDEDEAAREGLTEVAQIAEHFGVPREMVACQAVYTMQHEHMGVEDALD